MTLTNASSIYKRQWLTSFINVRKWLCLDWICNKLSQAEFLILFTSPMNICTFSITFSTQHEHKDKYHRSEEKRAMPPGHAWWYEEVHWQTGARNTIVTQTKRIITRCVFLVQKTHVSCHKINKTATNSSKNQSRWKLWQCSQHTLWTGHFYIISNHECRSALTTLLQSDGQT